MSSKPLVSIITIFLNAKEFIKAAVTSAIAQTYDNWELLLIDDGSTDGSSAIAQKYAQQYPEKIRYLEHDGHQNRGMSASRNLGIRNAGGKYITFLDSDDIWLSEKIEQQVGIIESQPQAGFVCNPARWWYSWTGNPEDISRDFVQKLDLPHNTLVQPPTLLLLFLQDEWASLCDVLVRREVVEAVGGYEESFRGMYEDQAFHAKLCLKSPVIVSSQCWYLYRQHPKACTFVSHNIGQTYNAARQKFLHWLEEYLIQQIQDPQVWKVVQKQLFPYRHPNLYRISCLPQNLALRVKRLVKL